MSISNPMVKAKKASKMRGRVLRVNVSAIPVTLFDFSIFKDYGIEIKNNWSKNAAEQVKFWSEITNSPNIDFRHVAIEGPMVVDTTKKKRFNFLGFKF